MELPGDAVIVATGGMHGLFGNTTGSLSNTLNTIAIAVKTKEELEQDTKNAATKGGILERGVEYFYEVIESELGNQAFSAACNHPISSGYWETLRSQVCSLSREAYERSLHLTSH